MQYRRLAQCRYDGPPHHVVVDVEVLVLVVEHLHQPEAGPQQGEGGGGVREAEQPPVEAGLRVRGQAQVHGEAPRLEYCK